MPLCRFIFWLSSSWEKKVHLSSTQGIKGTFTFTAEKSSHQERVALSKKGTIQHQPNLGKNGFKKLEIFFLQWKAINEKSQEVTTVHSVQSGKSKYVTQLEVHFVYFTIKTDTKLKILPVVQQLLKVVLHPLTIFQSDVHFSWNLTHPQKCLTVITPRADCLSAWVTQSTLCQEPALPQNKDTVMAFK